MPKGGRVTVQKMERKEKSESPPQLYDLTALQRDANRLLGFTAQQTLDYAKVFTKNGSSPTPHRQPIFDGGYAGNRTGVSAAGTACADVR